MTMKNSKSVVCAGTLALAANATSPDEIMIDVEM